MRAVFFGTPPIAVPALRALTQVAEVAAVVCQPDRPSGRGLKLTAPAVKEAALAAGLGPTDPGYGVEPEAAWGTLGVPGKVRKVPAERGAYPEFYRRLATALRGDGPVPVDPADAVAVLRIIEEVHWQAGG